MAALNRRLRRASPKRLGKPRVSRDHLAASDRLANPGHRDSNEAAIGGRGGPTRHPDPPPQGGTETSLVLLRGARGRSPVRLRGARANSRAAGVGVVVAAAAAHGRADHPTQGAHRIPAVTRDRADIAGGSEFAGIEWTGGALA